MAGTATKICGLTTADALNAAISGGAAHVGLVFFPPSPRHLGFDAATALAAQVPDRIGRVGVFVDPDDALLERAVAAGRLTALQLHKTAPERVAAIARQFALDLWVAVAVKTHGDLAQAKRYHGIATRILYDAKTPDDAALPGGMGMRFDWDLLAGHRHPLPWALSGGLDPANVGEAIRRTGAPVVDVSSGVESTPGVKDAGRIAAFLAAVASA